MNDAGACTYYSVDVEASGPVPGLYNLVSIGATAIRPVGGRALELGESFYAELKPVFPGQDAAANKVHGLDPPRLAREGLEPATAMARLTAFVERTIVPGSEAVFVGHVAVFDWMYISYYYAWSGQPNPFGYKGIDTKSLAMGLLGLPWPSTGKEFILERLGMAAQDAATVHRADADARHQAEMFVALLRRAGLAE